MKKMSRRRFLRMSTLTAAGVTLAACARSAPASQPAEATKPAQPMATPKPAETEEIVLTQWYHQYGEEGTQEAAKRYAEEYSAMTPGVRVEVNWIPGDYYAKLATALLSPEGPDVFEGYPSLAMVKANQIVPLDDLFTEDVKADFRPSDLAVTTVEGKIYAVKMVDDTGMLYYRKSLLEKAGVEPPATMDALIDAAKKLSSGRVKGLFLGNDGGVNSFYARLLLFSAGNEYVKDNKVAFNNERTAIAWEKLRELNESGALLIGAPTDWWDPSALIDGLTAMQYTGLWAMPAILKALGDDVDILPWPALDEEGVPSTFWGGWAEMVNAKSKHIEEAKAFVKWLWIDNKENQRDWNLSYGFHIPPRISIGNTAEALKSGLPAKAVQIADKYGHPLGLPVTTSAMSAVVTEAVGNIVKNQADAMTEVQNAAEKIQGMLDELLAG